MDLQNPANRMIGMLAKLWLAAAVLIAGAPSELDAQDDPVRVTFLDVGQGDAVLIQSPEGRTALIDAGPGVDLVSGLRDLGVDTLDLVIASHPHADHIGGMRQVLRAFPVRFYMDNGQPHTTTTYSVVMQELSDRQEIGYLQATPRSIEMGSTELQVLPLPARSSSNLNNASVGVVLEHGDFLGFFSGDSERPELMHFLQEGVVPDVTLLKAPHHGSDDAVSELFMQAARPEVVVISVGWANRYGHPRPAALRSYGAHADHLLRTDLHGRITVVGHPDGTYEIERGGSVVAQGAGGAPRPAQVPSSEPRPEPGEPGVEPVGPEDGTIEPGDEPVEPEVGTIEPGDGPVEPEVGTVGREDEPVEPGPASESRNVAIHVVADAPGNDHHNPNGEYAIIGNAGESPLAIGGWVLCDLARHCFTFPAGTEVPPAGSVFLFTGRGRNANGQLFWGSGSAIWNNRGDTATLYDTQGRVVTTHVYLGG